MDDRPISPAEALPRMIALLSDGQCCRLVVTGNSMLPFLRHERDAVILSSFCSPARVNEILFFQRENGDCVLHRVRRIEEDGSLLLCGDAQTALERVSESQVLARVTQVEKKGHRISCRAKRLRLAVWLWQRLFPIRIPLLKSALFLRNSWRKAK